MAQEALYTYSQVPSITVVSAFSGVTLGVAVATVVVGATGITTGPVTATVQAAIATSTVPVPSVTNVKRFRPSSTLSNVGWSGTPHTALASADGSSTSASTSNALTVRMT